MEFTINKNKFTCAIVNGKTIEEFGNIRVSYRKNTNNGTFSVLFSNRMNNQSIALHRVEKDKFLVEFGAANGVVHVVRCNNISVAAQLAIFNTDITRIDDDTAKTARIAFIRAISQFDRSAKNIMFTKSTWKVNRFRNKEIVFDLQPSEKHSYSGKMTGILNVILPPTGLECLVTPDFDPSLSLTVSTSDIWLS